MNTANNVTVNSINAGAPAQASAATGSIMKSSQNQSILPQSGIIPATIIATNERLNNSNNQTTANNSSISQQQQQSQHHQTNHEPQSVATTMAFTIHANPAQSIQTISNNLVSAAAGSAGPAQIQTVGNTNSSIIHPATMGITGTSVASSVVTTLIPTVSGQQVTAIPVGSTVLKGQPQVATFGPRFQATNVMTSTGPPSSGSINALFIHSDPSSKNQNVSHSTTNHHQSHIQQNSVINTNVTLQPISTTHTTPPTPLFVQTANSTPNSAIFQTNVANIGHNSSQPTNLSTINLSTSSVQQSQQQQTQQQQQQQAFPRLKVEDALSYLDQVKLKFNEKPHVYNDFLDIMKEFKSQSIDTPGVIQRVSNLFKGHPELIVGFNTFLPPGYKIEIQSDQVNVSMPNSTNVVLMPNNPTLPSHQQQTVATSAIVTSQNIHQLPGNLVRSTLVTTQNIHQTNHHSQSFQVNSIQARESNNTPLSSPSSTLYSSTNSSINQNRIDSSNHNSSNHRPSGHTTMETNSRGSNSSAMHSHMPNQNSIVPPPSGPVEFNHAINYVNKIKNRFQDQPDIYKQFLDILQSYQKEQDNSGQKILTESEVFCKVSKLFENQPDLLQEFSQFLPDAHSSNSLSSHHNSNLNASHVGSNVHNSSTNYAIQNSNQSPINYSHNNSSIENSNYPQQSNSLPNNDHVSMKKPVSVISSNSVLSNRNSTAPNNTVNSFSNSFHRTPKRSISNNQIDQHVSVKRSKLTPSFRDSPLPEAGKFVGDLVDYAFFDKLRNHLSPYNYETYMRCLTLFNQEIVNRSELAQLVQPLFSPCPDLYKKFKEMLGIKEGSLVNPVNSNHNLYFNLYNNSYTFSNYSYHTNSYTNSSIGHLEGLSNRIVLRDRRDTEYLEVDFTTCKRYGVSYRTIPKSSCKLECSGRTPLCREVLNDTLVSFPSWSEDSTFVSSRKTQYEEYVYRCEDERYELDLVLETNLSTIRVLESVRRKMENMTPEEKNNFKLDDTLGGTTQVIHLNSIRRIYGESSQTVIEGIKNSPSNVIPLVLKRLISKDEEWRSAQKQFNRAWREQNEKYYLKSLDHQGISFKQNDIKFLRSKSLLNEIENIAESRNGKKDEEKDQPQESKQEELNSENSTEQQPHMIFVYPDKSMIDVACNLIIHHVKRQTSIHKEDKRKIKQLMRHFIPDLYATPRGELSDDEIVEENKSETKNLLENLKNGEENDSVVKIDKCDLKPLTMLNSNPDEEYSLFFINDHWYLFFRLHYILCERLSKMHKRAQQIASEEIKESNDNSPSILLRLRNNLNVNVEDYFKFLVDMIKQVLDGNLDSNQYEDNLREMFSIHAYIAFTLDKVVQNIVRQLQHIVGDEVSQQCTELYLEACKTGSAGGLCMTSDQRMEEENLYQRNFEHLISEENRFKIVIYKGEGKVTIDLLESKDDEDEESTNEADEDSNVPQSSRTLRSSTKNMSEKERQKCLFDSQKLNEFIQQQLKSNPPYLKKYIRKHKSSFNQLNNNSNEEQNSNPNEDDGFAKDESSTNNKDNSNEETNENDKNNNNNVNKDACKFNLRCFKKLLIVQNENVLYSKNTSDKPRMSHKKISLSKFKRFDKWYSDWVERNCSIANKIKYEEWFLKNDTTNFKFETADSTDQQNNSADSSATAAVGDDDTKQNNNKGDNNDNHSKDNVKEINNNKEDNKTDMNNTSGNSTETQSVATLTSSNVVNSSSTDQIKQEETTETSHIVNDEGDKETTKKNKCLQKIRIDAESVKPYRTYYKYLFKNKS